MGNNFCGHRHGAHITPVRFINSQIDTESALYNSTKTCHRRNGNISRTSKKGKGQIKVYHSQHKGYQILIVAFTMSVPTHLTPVLPLNRYNVALKPRSRLYFFPTNILRLSYSCIAHLVLRERLLGS